MISADAATISDDGRRFLGGMASPFVLTI